MRSPRSRSRNWAKWCVPAAAVLVSAATWGGPYPLDGDEYTGIRRLRAYRMMQEGSMPGRVRLVPGARLPSSAITLRLKGINDTFDIRPDTPKDPQLQAALENLLRGRDPSYRMAIVDLTDPAQPRYAAVRGDQGYIPGSVGKILVMAGLFNELHQLYPNDVAARARILRETRVIADEFVNPNSHEVPVVKDDWSGVVHRRVLVGDEFSLWEWVDHMISPSSNAAGSMVWKQSLLLDAFGTRYPVSREDTEAFLRSTPPRELTERSWNVLAAPLVALGLDTTGLRLKTYFTRGATARIPSGGSYSTPNQLVRLLVKLEQGKVIDEWSSLEMKKLLYFTRRRYRLAASPALENAAVYFKSGSLYRCRPEPGYQCGQYRGNVENLLHAVAMVESPAVPAPGERQRVYLLSMMSNVLKVNSAGEHAEMGTRIHRLIESLHSASGP